LSPWIIDEPRSERPQATLVLAHGAGAPMDSPFMTGLTAALVDFGLKVVRFEFDYMAGRGVGRARRPPPPIAQLIDAYRRVVEDLPSEDDTPLLVGGKSMGGRVASLLAVDPPDRVRGAMAFGYPFHPPRKPDARRTEHFDRLAVPLQIVQGTRDAFGSQREVEQIALPGAVTLRWLDGGDHDYGLTARRNPMAHQPFVEAARHAAAFAGSLGGR
jgi:uncharacterized protein